MAQVGNRDGEPRQVQRLKAPAERIRNIVPTAAATIVHVVVEQGAGEARKAQ
jgi:hypothetical protein